MRRAPKEVRHRLPLGSQSTTCGIAIAGKMRPLALGGRDGEATTVAGSVLQVTRLADDASVTCGRCRAKTLKGK